MPDVGVLQLQIHDDSDQAARGLDALAGALERVQKAVTRATSLEGVAKQIKQITEAVSKAIPEDNIAKLERIGAALEKISAMNGVDLKGLKSLLDARKIKTDIDSAKGTIADGMGKAFEEVRESVGQIAETVQEIPKVDMASGFVAVEQRVEETNEALEEQIALLREARAEANRKANEARLEKNYEQYRDLFLNGGAPWTESVPAMYGLSPEILTEAETYAEAMQMAMRDVDEYVDHFIEKLNEPTGETLRDVIDNALGIGRAFNSAAESAEVFNNAIETGVLWVREMMREISKVKMLGSGQSPLLLGSGGVPNENALSTYVSPNQWSPNWSTGADWKPNWTYGNGMGPMGEVVWNASETQNVASGMEEVSGAAQSVGNLFGETASKTTMLTENMKNLDKELRQKKTDVNNVSEAFSEFRSGLSRLTAPITGFIKQFSRIARMRAIRAVIRQVTSGISEGVENYYRYSQAINSAFAPAMDSAATSLQTMKNSIGAALAPLIQSLIPYLIQLVNWFVSLLNYANQFIALMRGQSSWSRATEKSAKAFDDVKKSAKGASNAVKDLLADWDELNIIQSDSSDSNSGKGASAMTDALGMFEEVNKFDNGLQSLIKNIKEQFGSVWNLVKDIGTALLGWKISEAFTGILGTLGGLVAAGALIKLTFDIVTVMDNTYFDTKDPGWLVGDLLTTIVGATLASRVLRRVLGGFMGELAIPLTFGVSAWATVKANLQRTDVDALSRESIEASALAALKGGVAAGYLFHMAGYTLGEAIGGGIGSALLTFGVAIGLKAVAQVAENGALTKEDLTTDAISAAMIGAGLGLTEVTLGGTVATALTLAGGGALLAFAALVAIEAVVAEANRSNITWGNYDATKEEIQAFVENSIFEGLKPKVTISLANATFEELGKNKETLEENLQTVLGTLNAVSLGLTDSTEADLKTKVNELVKSFNSTTQTYQEALKISYSLVPLEGGEEENKKAVDASQGRWGELNGIMEGLAKDLTSAFDTAYNKDLDEVTRNAAKESVEKISRMMTEVATAIANGQAKAKAAHALNTALADLSHSSMDALLEEFRTQRDQLIEEMKKATTDGAEGLLAQQYAYEELAAYALREAGGDVTDEKYQHYLEQAKAAAAQYEEIMANLDERVAKEADKVLQNTQGVQKMRETLLDKTFGELPTGDTEQLLAAAGYADAERAGEYMKGVLDNADLTEAKEAVSGMLYALLYDAVGPGSFGTYTEAIESGVLKFGDFFSKDLIDTLASVMGIPDTGALREAWDQIVNEILGIGEAEAAGTEGVSIDIPVNINPIYGASGSGFTVETETAESTGKKPWLSGQASDSAWAGARRFAGRYTTGTDGNGNTELVVKQDNSEQKNNIQNGVTAATGNLLSTLQSIQRVMEAINRKDFTVNVTPSSAFGRTVQRSGRSYSAQTGESYSLN